MVKDRYSQFKVHCRAPGMNDKSGYSGQKMACVHAFMHSCLMQHPNTNTKDLCSDFKMSLISVITDLECIIGGMSDISPGCLRMSCVFKS